MFLSDVGRAIWRGRNLRCLPGRSLLVTTNILYCHLYLIEWPSLGIGVKCKTVCAGSHCHLPAVCSAGTCVCSSSSLQRPQWPQEQREPRQLAEALRPSLQRAVPRLYLGNSDTSDVGRKVTIRFERRKSETMTFLLPGSKLYP